MTDAEKLAETMAFLADFAKEPFPAVPMSFRHPADEPDPLTEAVAVWAWQDDAKTVLENLK
jgi:hypothetical protein